MAKALYRKYRPKSLGEVVGQNQVTEVLDKALKQGRISHAYLFVGPRGTGKTSVARIFAHEINGFPYELEDDYVDIIEIDGASNRGIDDIRELREKVAIAPSEGKYKVYIIDEVHMLTGQAFNALLKTLEEPPEHVVFVLATTDVNKVPQTILSRVQRYNFQLATAETMAGFLQSVAEKEGIDVAADAMELIVQHGGGSFRDSLSLFDQIATLGEGKISRELVVSTMGLPEEAEISDLLTVYRAGELGAIAETLRRLLARGTKPELLAEGMIRQILAQPNGDLMGLLARLPEVAAPFAEAKLLVALTAEASDGEEVASQKVVAKKKVVTETTAKNVVNSETKAAVVSPVFDWEMFKSKVSELNDAVAMQLNKTDYQLSGLTLNLYPMRKVVKNILERQKNLAILKQVAGELAGGLTVKLHEVGEKVETKTGLDEGTDKKSEKLAKISAIMGGEVKDYGGENPFGE